MNAKEPMTPVVVDGFNYYIHRGRACAGRTAQVYNASSWADLKKQLARDGFVDFNLIAADVLPDTRVEAYDFPFSQFDEAIKIIRTQEL